VSTRFREQSPTALVDEPSSTDLVEMLTQVAKLADEDLAEAKQSYSKALEALRAEDPKLNQKIAELTDANRKDQLAIWSVLVGGLKAALATGEATSPTADSLYKALQELARGSAEEESFSVRSTQYTRKIKDAWHRATVIAALQRYPEHKQKIIPRAARLLRIKRKAVAKMLDNYEQGRRRTEVELLVNLAKRMDQTEDPSPLKDLIR